MWKILDYVILFVVEFELFEVFWNIFSKLYIVNVVFKVDKFNLNLDCV